MKLLPCPSTPPLALPLAAALLAACAAPPAHETAAAPEVSMTARDPHTQSRPEEARVERLELDLDVDFEGRRLVGSATLTVAPHTATELRLDTDGLEISAVTVDGGAPAEFRLEDPVPFLGRALVVPIAPETRTVTVGYATSPSAAALQWLDPAQTAGGKRPFLFTQSQAILARSWVPCQDTPGVRMTYGATVRVPPDLMAVMSATNPTAKSADGVYRFEMPQPIPSYLLALAVGDLDLRSIGPDVAVYAEPSMLARAAWELEETQSMLDAVEPLYGPYRWGRYDVLVLPPSFPFGGMENPRLTFATPTILAGDRSLVALIAHELAHSWSGNLVTNANWNDFWLNEGFTVYLERRIMEAIKGRDYSEMLAELGLQDLRDTVARLGADSPDTRLRLDLAGRNPDDAVTDVAYEKGYSFLRALEEAVGREEWDAFLRGYFDAHAFQSLTTDDFLRDLRAGPLADPAVAAAVDVDLWLTGTGIPASLVPPQPQRFRQVEGEIAAWRAGKAASELATSGWSSHEWQHFVRNLPPEVDAKELAELDAAFAFTKSGSSEILAAWLERAIPAGYPAADPAIRSFLTGMGRRKFLRPLYQALADSGRRDFALEIYREARPTYHAVSRDTVDAILEWQG